MKEATTTSKFVIVPAAFPLNQALQSASLTLNNAKVSVQSADVLNVFTKQYDQKFLSKHMQTSPSYVDKYFGLAKDGLNGTFNSAWGTGIENTEKDSDTAGRSADEKYVCEVSLVVNEPILGICRLLNLKKMKPILWE